MGGLGPDEAGGEKNGGITPPLVDGPQVPVTRPDELTLTDLTLTNPNT